MGRTEQSPSAAGQKPHAGPCSTGSGCASLHPAFVLHPSLPRTVILEQGALSPGHVFRCRRAPSLVRMKWSSRSRHSLAPDSEPGGCPWLPARDRASNKPSSIHLETSKEQRLWESSALHGLGGTFRNTASLGKSEQELAILNPSRTCPTLQAASVLHSSCFSAVAPLGIKERSGLPSACLPSVLQPQDGPQRTHPSVTLGAMPQRIT